MLIRAVGSPLGAELSVAAQAGTGKGVRDFWALNYFCCLQRDRGRESLVGMLLLEDIFLAMTALGVQETSLSLSAHFLSVQVP